MGWSLLAWEQRKCVTPVDARHLRLPLPSRFAVVAAPGSVLSWGCCRGLHVVGAALVLSSALWGCRCGIHVCCVVGAAPVLSLLLWGCRCLPVRVNTASMLWPLPQGCRRCLSVVVVGLS